MGAPKGNQFWKLRSKHGRDTLFASAEALWQAATEYFDWCDKNPLQEKDYRGKDATMVKLDKMRPYTLMGLCLYLDCNSKYFNDFSDDLKKKKQVKVVKDFTEVVTRIRETIYTQQYTGAAAGFLNANIIARALGITEKTESKNENTNNNTHSGAVTVTTVHTGVPLTNRESDISLEKSAQYGDSSGTV